MDCKRRRTYQNRRDRELWEDFQDLPPTIATTAKDDFVILISHNPDYAEFITTHHIDLTVSGHIHGGQITFFGLWTPLMPSRYGPKYRTGLVETALRHKLISNGIGTIPPPVRFFSKA